jgi:hypothetical protein
MAAKVLAQYKKARSCEKECQRRRHAWSDAKPAIAHFGID